MKGYTEVDRVDLLSAIIGFGIRYDEAKRLQDVAILNYYDKHYVNGTWWSRLGNSKKTPREFVRGRIQSFGIMLDVLQDVVNKKEWDELYWFTWASRDNVKPVKALYDASSDKVLIDQDMANFVVQYKNYLENLK